MSLTSEQVTELRDLLEAEREEIVLQVKGVAGKAAASHGDSGDLSTSDIDAELTWGLGEHETNRLRELEQALSRMETGTYGICEMCEEPIPFARLKVMPSARYTVDCQEEVEREQAGFGRAEARPRRSVKAR